MTRYAVLVYALKPTGNDNDTLLEHCHGILILDAANEQDATEAGIRYVKIKCPTEYGYKNHYAMPRRVDDLSQPESEWRKNDD